MELQGYVIGRPIVCVLLLVAVTHAGVAIADDSVASQQVIPNPLTLKAVLALAEESHPDVDVQAARVASLRADLDAVKASYGVHAYLNVIPRWVDPAAGAGHDLVNDSRVRFSLYRKLYDFGRTRALYESAEAEFRAGETAFIDLRQRRQLDVMARFFDVILADLKYLADDEELALRYVTFDKARQRAELGMVSDVEQSALETAYREALDTRTESLAQRRHTRALLALSLNRPQQLPEDLERPQLRLAAREVPEFDATVNRALTDNPSLQVLRARVQAAENTARAEEALRRPVLAAEAGAQYLEREIGSRETARLGLQLRFPLYQGGEVRAAVAQSRAGVQTSRALLRKAELDLREQLLGVLKHLEVLQVQRQTAAVREEYRDRAVDLARGLYEMEVRTNLGESMARLTESQWRSAQVEFETALAWAQLDVLLGKPVNATTAGAKP